MWFMSFLRVHVLNIDIIYIRHISIFDYANNRILFFISINNGQSKILSNKQRLLFTICQYNKYKEEIKEEARNRYSSLSPEEKQKKIDYPKNYYLNIPEDKKRDN